MPCAVDLSTDIDAPRQRGAPFKRHVLGVYENDPGELRRTIDAGCQRAMAVAEETMKEVRQVVGTVYR